MKKNLILTLCLPALLLAGCTSEIQEPEVEVNPEITQKNVIITARIGSADTRVSYFEDKDGEGRPILHQQWNVGDWVFGFDDDDNALYLRVFEIVEEDGERIARLENTGVGCPFPESGYIHMFYLGKTNGESPESVDLYDFQSEKIIRFYDSSEIWSPFSYSEDPEWSVDNNTAAGIMTADAEVSSVVVDGVLTVSADLSFHNQMAIIGIEGLQVDPGVEIDRIELSGIRTKAAYQIVNNQIELSFDGFDAEDGIDINLADNPSADENGYIRFESPIFVAVFPRDKDADETEVELRARVSGWNEGEEPLFYALTLGKKTIEAGKYYYIQTKTFSGPPAVRVVFGDGEESSFSSLEEACDFIATLDDLANPTLQLLRDCTVNNPAVFTTTSQEQLVNLDLMGHTLTLENGAYLEASGPIQLFIFSGDIIQTSDAPVLLSSADVFFESGGYAEFTVFSMASSVSPIQVTDGAVTISGGYFGWTYGPLISSSSTYPSFIGGGRFSIHPTLTDNVVLQDGMVIAQDDYTDFPFLCILESVYDNLAHTSDGVIKLFSLNKSGYGKVYLTKNNLYRDQNNNWLFEEGPNWEGQNQDSDTHKNLFTFSELSNGSMYVSGDVSVGDDLYSWLNSSDWDALWNRSSGYPLYEKIASYMKCNVEDSEDALWRNLLVFPDTYDWPSGAGEIPDAINNGDMPWSDAPVFTADQANALIDAGFVFLPAAVPAGSEGYYGGYLSSDSEIHYIFNNEYVDSNREPRGSNYNRYSLHVYYPCN